MSDIKYSKHMLKLWNLAGEIGTLAKPMRAIGKFMRGYRKP